MDGKRVAFNQRGNAPLSKTLPPFLGIRIPLEGIESMKQRERELSFSQKINNNES